MPITEYVFVHLTQRKATAASTTVGWQCMTTSSGWLLAVRLDLRSQVGIVFVWCNSSEQCGTYSW